MTDDQKLLTYPCHFPVKVMGKNSDSFIAEIEAILSNHFPDLSTDNIKKNYSKGNKFLSITAIVYAQSQNQLDDLYQDLTSNSQVVMAL